jgi:hypothetical protein
MIVISLITHNVATKHQLFVLTLKSDIIKTTYFEQNAVLAIKDLVPFC